VQALPPPAPPRVPYLIRTSSGWLLFSKSCRGTDCGVPQGHVVFAGTHFGGRILRSELVTYGLLVALAIGLLAAAFTDLKRRQIDNWLNAAIALAAPAFWWASGLALWPGVAWQLGVAAIAFCVLAGLFAMRMMGGGDVKLLAALALWIRPEHFLWLVVWMSVIGGVLTVVFGAWHVTRRQSGRIAIPYGVAICAAALLTVYAKSLPALQASLPGTHLG
jgi:prepilin peptidase CpaA